MASIAEPHVRQRRVFDSVFSSSDKFTQPTPLVLSSDSGEPFGGPEPFRHDRTSLPISALRNSTESPEPTGGSGLRDESHDQEIWARSWHRVTSTLAIPDEILTSKTSFQVPTRSTRASHTSLSRSLRDVLDPRGRLPGAEYTEDLLAWYTHQARHHFLRIVLRQISQATISKDPLELVTTTVSILEDVHRQYLERLSVILQELAALGLQSSETALRKFRQDLHAIIGNSLMDSLEKSLRRLLTTKAAIILGLDEHVRIDPEHFIVTETRRSLHTLVGALYNVGLAGERFQIIFAEVMDKAMSRYIHGTFAGIWTHKEEAHKDSSVLPWTANQMAPSTCITQLCSWIESRYARLASEILIKIQASKASWADVERWKEMSIGRLVALRTEELFDIVLAWPASKGALDDLRAALTTPQRRLELTDVFSQALSMRLLHSGTSTLRILRAYISIISSFHTLDNSRVLLDRVAYPLQVYLRSRDDTVKIIITGLLADSEDEARSKTQLTELAALLHRGLNQQIQMVDDDLDWDDLDWVPDPVDAGPGYRRSKNADIIGTLIDMLGAKEVFIKEFQSIIGENLLRGDGSHEKEIKVLGLLKARFGEGPLQSCEVMIKDIQDSRRVNQAIRRLKELGPSEQEIQANRASSEGDDEIPPEGLLRPSLHARILSRLFWPQLQDDEYHVPQVIADLQTRYEQGFEDLKSSRKLTWLPALGQATVELEFEDRVLFEEVHTWQATVIWAFQGSEGESVSLSVPHLVDILKMDEALVRSALGFWVSKFVLYESSPDTYTVLETLNQDERAQAAATGASSTKEAGVTTVEDEVLAPVVPDTAKMAMYWQFIQGMLTNAAPQMPLQQIAMMLKMLIADGFPYSNEELGEFLAQKVEEGELVLVGGKYKLKK